jgi:Spy/CpxP family protein refolding chaperone
MNRNSHRGMALALIMAGLVSIAPSILAQRGHGGPGGRGGRDPFAALSLTADQKARIDAIRASFESQTASLRQQMQSLREQMRTARQNNDQAAMSSLRTQEQSLHTQMKGYHDQMDQQVRSVLTAEQIAKLDEMHAQRGEGGRGGHRGDCAGKGGNGTGADQGAKQGTIGQSRPSTGASTARQQIR